MIVDFFEIAVDGNIGIKASFDGCDIPAQARKLAAENAARSDKVWVWAYAVGMDLQGPALCVGYAHGGDVRCEMIDPRMIAIYYAAREA